MFHRKRTLLTHAPAVLYRAMEYRWVSASGVLTRRATFYFPRGELVRGCVDRVSTRLF